MQHRRHVEELTADPDDRANDQDGREAARLAGEAPQGGLLGRRRLSSLTRIPMPR